MTKSSNLREAGLVFLEERDIDVVAAANHTASALESMGHRITGVHVLSDDRAQVSTKTHEMMLDLLPDVQTGQGPDTADLGLNVTLYGNSVSAMSRFTMDAVLACVLQALNDTLEPDFVQWKEHDVLLPSAQFARANKGKDAPGAKKDLRNTPCKSLPDVEATNAVLQERISSQDPEIFENLSSPDRIIEKFSDGWVDPELEAEREAAEAYAREIEDIEEAAPLRLSAWFMSFAVVLIALPVGVALVIVNMAKGENLRLSSQTAALTGTFVAFQALGTTANALEAIDKFLM